MMTRKTAFTFLLIASIVLAILSTRLMLASMWDTQVNTFLVDWEQKGLQPKQKAWQIAFNAVNKSISLSPIKNANYYDHLGRVWEWKQFNHPFGDKTATESREHALQAYRQSVILKPQWPYTWVSLAYIKLRLNQLDEEFNDALQSAFRLGPWRIKSNKHIANMGLTSWSNLEGKTKIIVMSAIKRTVSYGPRDARWLENRAKENGQHTLFCLFIIQEMKEKRKVCMN